MKITKGQHLHVSHTRKGEFDAVATEDFDTNINKWYPIAVAEGNPVVKGLKAYWGPGDKIPCRRTLATIIVVRE